MSSLSTRTVRAGIERDASFGAVVPPLHLSSNYTFAGFGSKRAYDYTRTANPTRDLLAEAIADLERGAGAVVTASGMAAVHLVLHLLPAGARVLAPRDGYGGTWRLLQAEAKAGRLQVELADFQDLDGLRAACARRPALVWIETPSNPLLRVTDLAAVIAIAHAAGALACVDNTFLSPVLQQPLAFGADLVVHSTTKYLNGHSDVVGGAVVAATPELHAQLAWWANCIGIAGAPFDAWLTLRGLRTLHARMRQHEANARAVAEWLVRQPEIAAVHWPGLPEHPGHELACVQQRGFGAIVALELHGGEAAVRAFLARLRLFSLAESLGGVESLVAHPATMTHAAMSAPARAAAGIGDGLLRLSIGIEEPRDLIADLATALAATRDPLGV